MDNLWDNLTPADALAVSAAQSKRPSVQDAPTQQPMRAGIKPAQQRKPSGDQKKVRRQMAKNSSSTPSTPTKESSTMTAQPTEATLLSALANAQTLAEQTEAANRLEAFRVEKRASLAAEGSLWGNLDSPLPDPLYLQRASEQMFAPVTASVRLGHTEATDWFDDITPTTTEDAVLSAKVRATASQWFADLWAPVKADDGEFSSQAFNQASRTAMTYGLQRHAAHSVFLDQVAHLASREGITLRAFDESVETYVSDGRDSLPVGVSPTDTDAQRSMDEWGLDSDNNNSGDPKTTPGAGEAPSLSEGDSPETGSNEGVENPAAGQKADASTYDVGNTEDKLLSQQSSRTATWGPDYECKHCGRSIVEEDGRWVDPEATGDDSIWRETCDEHDTFTAEHEPKTGSKTSAGSEPPWLRERVDDPYGTPNKAFNKDTEEYYDHPFWTEHPPEVVGRYKIINVDGKWYGYDTSQNLWTKGFTDKAEVLRMAEGPRLDMWASKTAGEVPEAFKEQQKGSGDSGGSGNTCSVCGDKIAKDPSGEDPSTWHHDNGETHDHEAKPSKTSKMAKVSVTDVGIYDAAGGICTGKADGKDIKFKVSQSDITALKAVLFSDLGMNFSGVEIDESDILTPANAEKSAGIFDRMAAFFGKDASGIHTLAEDTSAPDSVDGLGGINEGDTPETGHQEGFQHTPPRGNLDLGSPTDSDRPGGGVNWGSGGGAAKDQTGAYTSKASLSQIGSSFRGKRVTPNTATFAASLERCASIDDEVGGVSARQIVSLLLEAPDVPKGIKGHLASHLSTEDGGAAPFVREALAKGDRVKVQVGSTDRGTGEIVGDDGNSGVALLYKVKLDSGETISVADTNLKKAVKTAEQFGRNTPDASTCDHEGGYEEKDGKKVCAECGLPWAIVEKRKGKEAAQAGQECPRTNCSGTLKSVDGEKGTYACDRCGQQRYSSKTASEWGDAHPGKERCPKTEQVKGGGLDQQRYVRCQGEKGHDGDHTFDEAKTFPAPTASKTGGTVKVPEYPECDIHKYEKGQSGVPAKYDAPTTMGPWANMCEGCYATHGTGGDALKTTFVKEGSKTASHYCTTHQVWVGDGNRDTHTRDSCNVEQRKKKSESVSRPEGTLHASKPGGGTICGKEGETTNFTPWVNCSECSKAVNHRPASGDTEPPESMPFSSSLSTFSRLVQAGLSRVADIYDDGMGGMPGPTNSWDCEQCGTTVERYRGEGDVSCPRCGAQYNASGQRLRDDWASNPSNYDDEIGDMEGYEQSFHDASRRTAGDIGDFRLNQYVMFNDRTPTGMGLAGETGIVEGINTADGTLTISVPDDEGDHREVTVSPAIVETTGTSYTGSRRPFAREAGAAIEEAQRRGFPTSTCTACGEPIAQVKGVWYNFHPSASRACMKAHEDYAAKGWTIEPGMDSHIPATTASHTAEGQKYICPYCDFNGSHAEVGKHIEDAGPEHQANGSVTDQLNDKIRREKKGSKTAATLECSSCHTTYPAGESKDPYTGEELFIEEGERCPKCNGAALKVAKTAMPSPAEAGIEVGDIYYSDWGYDQTNIDFYEVTRLMGASVAIRPIQKRVVEHAGAHDMVVAVPGAYTSGEMTKRVQSGSKWLNINSYSSAAPWDGNPKYQTGYGYGH